MNTKEPFLVKAFGHVFSLEIRSQRVCDLQRETDHAIETGRLDYANALVHRSIAVKGFESVEDSIAFARIEKRR